MFSEGWVQMQVLFPEKNLSTPVAPSCVTEAYWPPQPCNSLSLEDLWVNLWASGSRELREPWGVGTGFQRVKCVCACACVAASFGLSLTRWRVADPSCLSGNANSAPCPAQGDVTPGQGSGGTWASRTAASSEPAAPSADFTPTDENLLAGLRLEFCSLSSWRLGLLFIIFHVKQWFVPWLEIWETSFRDNLAMMQSF